MCVAFYMLQRADGTNLAIQNATVISLCFYFIFVF